MVRPKVSAEELARRVAANIERLCSQAGITTSTLIEESGIGRSVFYSRIGNKTSWPLDGLASVAAVFAIDPAELLAASPPTSRESEVLIDGSVLSRRISLLIDQVRLEVDGLVSETPDGAGVSEALWNEFARRKDRYWAPRSALEAAAKHFDIDPVYFTAGPENNLADRIEAQLELRAAVGGKTIGMRALGDVSPNALRAIAKSLRSGGSSG